MIAKPAGTATVPLIGSMLEQMREFCHARHEAAMPIETNPGKQLSRDSSLEGGIRE